MQVRPVEARCLVFRVRHIDELVHAHDVVGLPVPIDHVQRTGPAECNVVVESTVYAQPFQGAQAIWTQGYTGANFS